MLRIKSLISYCKIFLLGISFLFLSACSVDYLFNTNTTKLTNLVMVNQISEEYGILLTTQLQYYFGTNKPENSKYLLNTQIDIQENLQLTNKYGFSTQSELWISISWQLLDIVTNKVYVSSSEHIPAYYSNMPSSYATLNNRDITVALAIKNLAKSISFKIIALLKETNGDIKNTTSLTTITKVFCPHEN